MDLKEEDAKNLLAYQSAAESPAFVDLIRKLYHSCRDKARDAFEKSEQTAAYWSGRADSLERLYDFMTDSKRVDLSKMIDKPHAKK